MALQYSSGSVDGRVGSTNNQPSWVGEGWDLQFGYVEAHYRSCRADGQTIDDLCYDSDIEYSIVFNGKASRLVLDDTQGTWRAEDDEGWRIERRGMAWANNEVHDGVHWVLFTQDGTGYWFGSDVDSVQAVPVFGDDSTEPCHEATLAASYCDMGYRWNLRRVLDRRGNYMDYVWQEERQNYGRFDNAAAHRYDRAATLRFIEYGGNENAPAVPHSAQVEFHLGWRCTAEPCMGGTGNEPKWYDTPWDLYCAEAATTCPGVKTPAFYTWMRLYAIHTRVRDAAGTGWVPVDRWSTFHVFPGTGDGSSMALWLQSIAHYGVDGSTELVGDAASFEGVKLANRVYLPNQVAMYKYRIEQITTNTGGDTRVAYAPTECTHSTLPAEENNGKRCFPVHWSNGASDWNWFHKYVVDSVTEKGTATGDVDETWSYIYANPSTLSNSGVMWAWDDTPNTEDVDKTWGQWRGYLAVSIVHGTGTGAQRSEVRRAYHRGLNGDRVNRSGGARSVTMSDGDTAGIVDDKWLKGWLRTETTMDTSTGTRAVWVRHVPVAALSAYQLATFGKAYIVREASTLTSTLLRDNTVRTRQQDTTWDILDANEDVRYGLPLSSHDFGDVAAGSDDTCVTTDYVQNVTAWMLNFPDTVITTKCAASLGDANYLSGSQTVYDNGIGLSKGLATTRKALEAVAGTSFTWVPAGTAAYDRHGRQTETRDGLNRATTTDYTPATGGPVTKTVATNAQGHVTTTDVSRRLGLPTKVTDPNNKVTTLQYDPLGRLTNVWLPGVPASPLKTPSISYDYLIRDVGGSVVTTTTLLQEMGLPSLPDKVLTTHAFFDARLRARQTQAPAPEGGRVIADTVYTDRGQAAKTATYLNEDAPPATPTMVVAADADIPSQHAFLYDSLGRQTADILKSDGVEKWRTSTTHWGDQTFVDQPVGGTDTTTIVDALGRTTLLKQQNGTGTVDTSYGYDRLGRLSSVTDADSNTWTYIYDLLGNKRQDRDPDRGITYFDYDYAGQLVGAKDSRAVKLVYDYDNIGRKTAVKKELAPNTWNVLATWAYDTIAKGQLTAATRKAGGVDYITRVTSYDAGYRPLQTETVIPTGPLAGTYTFNTTYRTNGAIATQTLPAAGGLPGETLTYSYNDVGLPTGLTGATTYIADTKYYHDGQIMNRYLGAAGKQVEQAYAVDDATRRVTGAQVGTESAATPGDFDARTTDDYQYDQAGNVTVIAGKTNGTRDQIECFTYDTLRRLTAAWVEGALPCDNPPARAGAAPYQYSWEYDNGGADPPVGNRTKQISYDNTGVKQSTDEYAYTTTGHPHALTTVTHKNAAGTVTGTDSYTYDATGNTTGRTIAGTTQTLTWDDEGHLATVTQASQTTSYIYDAEGNRLLATDPTGTTLYLPGHEIRHTTATGQTTCTRYYNGVAARTTSGGFTWLLADHHGTNQLTINPVTLDIQRRRSLPFGGPRGTQPTTWPGQQGFVGGTNDPTGLTHLGAREYDPSIGRFISIDPLMDLADPQQWNGYTYAGNNPATNSDPTGLLPNICLDVCGSDDDRSFQKAVRDQRANARSGNGGGDPGDGGGTADNSGGSGPPTKRICGRARCSDVLDKGPAPGGRSAGCGLYNCDSICEDFGTWNLLLLSTVLAIALEVILILDAIPGDEVLVGAGAAATLRWQQRQAAAARAGTWYPNTGGKLPASWGTGRPTQKGVGFRWQDPKNQGNGVRIDRGNPTSSYPSQQVDHVIVRVNGKVIGRDGKPINGAIDQDPTNAHILLSEWTNWSSWDRP